MATLFCVTGLGKGTFSISPIRNESGDDASSCAVEFYPDACGKAVNHVYSASDPFSVWILARTFAEAPLLVGATVPIDLLRNGRGRRAEVYQTANFLDVVLFGIGRRGIIGAHLYVYEDDTNFCRHFTVRAPAEDVKRFGDELEQEIRVASPGWARSHCPGEDHAV